MPAGPNTYRHALVRPPGESFARALSSTGAAIDPARARNQHGAYCNALQTAGFAISELPPDETLPDSCFMQDPALIVADQGILCRMGAPERAGEPAGVSNWLRSHFPTTAIQAPGTLEGGDVLLLPDRVLVGESGRTNAAGIAQLAEALRPSGIPVEAIPVTRYLHLLSAVTYVGHNIILALPDYAEHPAFRGFDVVVVPPEEASAADALGTGKWVILPEGNPHTTRALEKKGLTVLAPPLSEFAAADGGVTCLALVW